jgi:hypothetical protein
LDSNDSALVRYSKRMIHPLMGRLVTSDVKNA